MSAEPSGGSRWTISRLVLSKNWRTSMRMPMAEALRLEVGRSGPWGRLPACPEMNRVTSGRPHNRCKGFERAIPVFNSLQRTEYCRGVLRFDFGQAGSLPHLFLPQHCRPQFKAIGRDGHANARRQQIRRDDVELRQGGGWRFGGSGRFPEQQELECLGAQGAFANDSRRADSVVIQPPGLIAPEKAPQAGPVILQFPRPASEL